jgi:hypothetical protein
MPVHINCPHCRATLAMPENMFGRPVRCPTCKQAFQCPAPPGVTRPPAPAPAAPPAPPPAAGNVFDFDDPRPASAPRGYADDYEDDYDARPRRRGGWGRVQGGFIFLWISAGCFFLLYLLIFILGQERSPSPSTGKLFATLVCLLFVAATALGAVGLAMCCAVPQETGSKGAVTVAMASMCVATGMGLVSSIMILSQVYSSSPFRGGLESLPVFLLLTVGALTASFILFIFFLTINAMFLRHKGLLASIMAYVVVTTVSPVALAMLAYIHLMTAGPRTVVEKKVSIEEVLSLLLAGAATLWFSFLLVGLSAAISRAQRRARG